MQRLKFVLAVVAFGLGLVGTAGAEEMHRPVVSKITPNYPEVARRMRVAGTVVVEVTALPSGAVTGVHAISGHPLLMQAAEDCVSHWRFLPEKTRESGTVAVIFTLGE
jgi:TonB family protein